MKTLIAVARKTQQFSQISTHLMMAEIDSAVMIKKDLILNLDMLHGGR
jgi:hypothetical protein